MQALFYKTLLDLLRKINHKRKKDNLHNHIIKDKLWLIGNF